MRQERCEVEVNAGGQPLLVRWYGHEFPVTRVLRHFHTPAADGLSLTEHWRLECGKVLMHVYAVEYGAAGFRRARLWWLGAIDPDPRGFLTVQ